MSDRPPRLPRGNPAGATTLGVDNSSRFKRNFILLVATLAFFVEGLILFSYPAVSSVASVLLGLSNTQSGLITASFGLAYAVLQIPGGIMGDRFGGGKTLLFSLLIASVAPVIMIVGKDFGSALLSRVISGAACGIVVPSSVRLASSWFPRRLLDKAMGVYGAGWAASQVVSFLVLPLLLSGVQWELPMSFVVLFCLVVTLLAVFPAKWEWVVPMAGKNPDVQHSRPGETEGTKNGMATRRNVAGLEGLFTRQLIALILPNFAALAVSVGVLTWAPSFLDATLGLTNVDAGRIAALIGIGGVVGSLLGGYGANKIGARAIIGISMMLAAITPTLLGSLSGSVLAASVWLLGVGLAEMLYLPASFALVPYASPRGPKVAGLEFGIFNTLSNFGTFVAPILMGYVLDSGAGFPWAFTLLGVLALSGLIGVFFLKASQGEGT